MWVKASTIFSGSSIPLAHQLLIISLCSDRAALILDIPSSWVPFSLTDVRCLAEQLIPETERNDPMRFLPGDISRRSGERWSSYVSRIRPSGWSWLDMIAAGSPISAQAVAQVAAFVYEHMSGQSDQSGALQALHIPSFKDLCERSHLPTIARSLLHVPGSGRLQIVDEFEPPRKRIKAFENDLMRSMPGLPASLADLRFPEHMLLANSVRIQLLSIQASWKSFKSGILCWGAFMDTMFPFDDHMVVTTRSLRAFASVFRNAGSLNQYLSHLRLAVRMSSGSWVAQSDVLSSIIRGLKKVTIRRPAGTISRSQMKHLIKSLLHRDRMDLARFIIIAYHFMTRVQSELYPLQFDGRSHNPSNWHSFISVRAKDILITYHHRKNAPNGAVIKRTCICESAPDLLCGVCCVRALYHDRRSADVSVFTSIHLQADMFLIRSILEPIGISSISWHSFRRSCAQDMLRSGCTISQIIRAGGWRSAAFVQYLNRRDLDDRAHLNLICQDSDSDDAAI